MKFHFDRWRFWGNDPSIGIDVQFNSRYWSVTLVLRSYVFDAFIDWKENDNG